MDSGTVYRMGLDRSHVDKLTVGPVNPFGLMFDSAGQLFVADCHTKPVQSVLRGANYEHFGRPHEGLGYYPKIMGHLHGSTAIGGVVVIDDDRWPAEFRGNLLCGNPMTSRVDRDSIVLAGSTQSLKEQDDFVKSDDPWFRPVAFAMAPDGSIYMADFYNRIIGHYEVPLTHPGRDRTSGRIWRIVPPLVPQNASADYPADLTTASAKDLVHTLTHPNIIARTFATDQLTDRIGKDAIPAVRAVLASASATQKVHALWTLFRLGDVKPEEIAAAAKDASPLVRTHAARMLSELKELSPDQRSLVLGLLKDADALTRRCAADALFMHSGPDAVRPLLDLITKTDAADAHLIYVARIALRRQLEQPGALAALAPANDADAAAINSVLPAIKTPESAAVIVKQMTAGKLAGDAAAAPDLIKIAARYGGNDGATIAAAYARQHLGNNLDAQLDALKALQAGLADRGGRLEGPTREWAAGLVGESLKKRLNARQVETLADLARALSLKEAAAPLAALMSDAKADPNTRLAAIKAVLALDKSNAPAVAALVADANQSANVREAAARALAEVNTDESRQSLLMPIRLAPNAVATKLAVALASRPEGANTLLDAIERHNLSPRLLTEPTVKDKLAAAKIKDLDSRISALTKNLAPASAQLDKLIAARQKMFDAKKADPEKGKAVFAKTCVQCHQVDGQGALVGPQLDGIGSRGLDRILEDVIDPNRNVDPNFRFSNVTLKDGDTISGLIRSDTAGTLTLVDPTGKEQAIPKKDIDTVEVSKLSLMPTGFGEIIPPDDFNHLLGYLLSKNAAAPAKQP
jgi:putative heme-binding domain-containing protein